jgi:hypothetical protein
VLVSLVLVPRCITPPVVDLPRYGFRAAKLGSG